MTATNSNSQIVVDEWVVTLRADAAQPAAQVASARQHATNALVALVDRLNEAGLDLEVE